MNSVVGTPRDRGDGAAKVTGQARYAADYPQEGLVHASVVSSTIARGRVVKVNSEKALQVPGVIAVLDPTNRPHVSSHDDDYSYHDAAQGSPLRP